MTSRLRAVWRSVPRLAVYFAPNTNQGFADAISQAVHDAANKPSAISISWGSPESGWTGQAIAAMSAAFADAAALGVTVTAASGDSLATDGVDRRQGACRLSRRPIPSPCSAAGAPR